MCGGGPYGPYGFVLGIRLGLMCGGGPYGLGLGLTCGGGLALVSPPTPIGGPPIGLGIIGGGPYGPYGFVLGFGLGFDLRLVLLLGPLGLGPLGGLLGPLGLGPVDGGSRPVSPLVLQHSSILVHILDNQSTDSS